MVHLKADSTRNAKRTGPEYELLAALLERTLLDLRSPDSRIIADARNWIWSDIDSYWSFVWVLGMLGLDNDISAFRSAAQRLLNGEYLLDTVEQFECPRGRRVKLWKRKCS